MAVLRIFDVLARVQERSAIKAAVHIPGVRNIVSLDDPQEAVSLLHSVLSGIRSTALLLLCVIITHQIGYFLVEFYFCHKLYHSVRCA